jgi:hypothetical protein
MDVLIGANPIHDELETHAARIRTSGILARSAHLHSLFEYLYRCHISGKTPKELEIAIEGMGREESFDVTQDAVVRVYVHKLRRKLDEFYAQQGKDLTHRLHLPKGEYRLVLESRELILANESSEPNPTSIESTQTESIQKEQVQTSKINILLAGTVITLLLINLLLVLQGRIFFSEQAALRNETLWQPLFADDRPILVVVGDYFIFAESDTSGNVKRLVRDFELNSPTELTNHLQLNPEQAEYKFDIGLSYLPTSTAYALNKISPLLNAPNKTVQVIVASQLTAEALRNSHIVYVGHLSGLGLLSDAVFDVSGFAVGRGGFDELVDTSTGQTYSNSSGIPGEYTNKGNHFAYLAAFNGPTNNRIIAVAGFRDAGLIELTDSITSETGLSELSAQISQSNFEAIYQTSGFGQATSPATLLVQKPIQK